jgi:hypothetical protein
MASWATSVCVFMYVAGGNLRDARIYIAQQSNELRSSVSRRLRRPACGQGGVETISIPLPSIFAAGLWYSFATWRVCWR